MAYLVGKTKRNANGAMKSIMKREKMSAAKLAKTMGGSEQALRSRLRGDSKFSLDEFINILTFLGYAITITKESDIIK